ncbi:MAG: amidohydrolase family protein, partial [Planctomycetota bacterium]
MAVELFDAFAGCCGTARGEGSALSPAELAADLQALSIQRALVHYCPLDMDIDPVRSNQLLIQACCDHDGFQPCPVVVPNGCGDVERETDQVSAAVAAGAGAVTVRPNRDGWSLAEWCCGPLFEALAERRMAVFCLLSQVGYEGVAELAARYPGVPFIVADLSYREQRIQVPLLRRYANIHLAIGARYCVHQGLENFVEQVGPEQILFGTGWPISEPMCAGTYLMYSSLSEDEKRLIGSGNMVRLTGG